MAQYPESYNSIAEIIGEGAARKLCEAYGGEAIYIPKVESLQAVERVTRIRQEYNGQNVTKLAKRYKLTERRVQQIVEDLPGVLPGQLSMFRA